jgi:hypothetical protein
MKQSLFITVLCLGAGFGVARAADHTFTGEIMDSQCAQIGSRGNMMKGVGAKNAAVVDAMSAQLAAAGR